MPKTAIQITEADQVATAVVALEVGDVVVVSGVRKGHTVQAKQPIPVGHKIALADIAPEEEIRKYGEVIGAATEPIQAGEWVHVHNCRGMKGRRFSGLASGRGESA